jgi:hypothetical protein
MRRAHLINLQRRSLLELEQLFIENLAVRRRFKAATRQPYGVRSAYC